jgi:hypothetical protein
LAVVAPGEDNISCGLAAGTPLDGHRSGRHLEAS